MCHLVRDHERNVVASPVELNSGDQEAEAVKKRARTNQKKSYGV